MKVHIATPAYDGMVHAGFSQSMLLSGYVLAKAGIECSATISRNGAFIDSARSLMVQEFLETDATHLMFVDSDLKFDPYAIASLVNAGLPVCCGVYRQRNERVRYLLSLTGEVNQGWLAAERVPAGFLCIERRVLEVMSERAERFLLNDRDCPLVFRIKRRDGRITGEDFSFCDDYMALYREGVFQEPIWVWPDIDFVHAGYPCNFHESCST